jgi:hypothetical protein
VNGSDVKRRIDRLYDRIVALLEAEINHDVRGYEVANAVCQRLATRLCDINIAYLLPRALDDYGSIPFVGTGTHTNCAHVLRERPGVPATGNSACLTAATHDVMSSK